MHLVWMRTENGKTVIEDLEIPSTKEVRGCETPILPINGAIFRTSQPQVEMGYHNAPRRQIVVPLEGEVEIETGEERRGGEGSGEERRGEIGRAHV